MMNVQPVSCTGGQSRIPSTGRQSRRSGVGFDTVAETLIGAIARLFATLRVWSVRARERRHLMALDDRMLRDIGISRAEAMREFDTPFWRP